MRHGFEQRNQFKVTGSKIYEAIGLDTVMKMVKHFDKVVKNVRTDEQLSEEVKQRMQHGTDSEIHAIATLVGKVLPFYFPKLQYVEESAHEIKRDDEPFFLISPDGSLGTIEINATKRQFHNKLLELG